MFRKNIYKELFSIYNIYPSIMSIKRLNKFNRLLSIYRDNQLFKKVAYLYENNIIKQITTAENILKKVKLTKKKELFKSSIKTIEQINNQYKREIEKNKISEEPIIKINWELIDNNVYNFRIHYDELKKLKNPNNFLVQTVKFYGKISEKQQRNFDSKPETITITKSNNIFNRKYFDEVRVKTAGVSLGDTLIWVISSWCQDNKKINYCTIETRAFKKVDNIKKLTNQLYQLSETNTCVYDGFINFFGNSDCKKKRTIYNKLIKNKNIYAKAYTDETLKEICEFTQSNLLIKDLINGNDKKTIIQNARYNLTFLNTKYNHLDLTTNTYSEIIEVEKEEYQNLKDKKNFWIEEKGKLITLDNIYKIKDTDFHIIYKEWKEQINYYKYLLSSKDEARKLIENYDFSIHTFFNNNMTIDNNLYKELDIQKAYFNYSDLEKNPYYKGVPSGSFINFKCEDNFNIDLFEKQYTNLLGYYEVQIIDIKDKIELFKLIGIKKNNKYVFTSVQIDSFKKYIDFKFLNISVSPSIHLAFSEQLKQNKYYCKAFGLMLCSSDIEVTTVKPLLCDNNYYNLIYTEEINIYENNGLIKINKVNSNYSNMIHIAHYIHSYTKNLIFNQLLEFENISDIKGVKLDSIVFNKEAKINRKLQAFHQEYKEAKIEGLLKKISSVDDYGDEEFIKSGYFRKLFNNHIEEINYSRSFLPNFEPILNKIIFSGGKGGSGKSTSVLKYNNNRSVCMVAKSWNLTANKKKEYENIKVLSINKAVGDNCDKVDIREKILLLDELTMWEEKDILTVIEDNKDKFIFLVGDIDQEGRFYQCNFNNKVFNPSNINLQYVTYIKNYRFDEELNNILDGLRLQTNRLDQYNYIKEHFKNNFKTKEEINKSDLEDTVYISDLNDTEKMTDYLVSKGAKLKYFIKDTIFNKGQYRGAELIDRPENNNYIYKLFKTIHSYQGLELNHNQKIIIYNQKNFDFNLYYTAFSRARRLDQIIILQD
jgi:hypothetical protein